MAASNLVREARGLTGDELLALPAVIDLDTSNRALMIGRSTGYGLAKQGEYPVKVLRLGNAYRVVTADLLKLLGLERQRPGGGKPEARADEHLSHPRDTLGCDPAERLSELFAA